MYELVLAGAALVLALHVFITRRATLPRPPGPKGLPLVGNAFQMPQVQAYLVFATWAKKNGDIMSFSLVGQTLIIVSSAEVANELFNKRYAIYSDRPVFMLPGVLMGWDKTLGFMSYGPRFLVARRMLHAFIGSRATLAPYHRQIELEAQRLLRRLLDRPERIPDAIRQTTGSIILNLAYGYQTKEHNDPFVKRAEGVSAQLSSVIKSGAFLVDSIHWLRHVPAWMPGAGFQRLAAAGRAMRDDMVNTPLELVQSRMADGSNVPNCTSQQLEKPDLSDEDRDTTKWTAAALYAGGADTTVSSIHTFILAMTLHAEIQAEAQAELDAVVGPARLPTSDDRAQLPYVDALVKEVFRWKPVAPLGMAHCLTQDDDYAGYHLPAGAMVMPNIWAMLHAPDVYADPEAFRPGRFLGPAPEPDPRKLVFGFGRRVCPGQALAETSVWLSCALVLAALRIRPVKDAAGRDVLPEPTMQNGMTSHPEPFPCEITPRSEHARELIFATPYADEDA